ncbi:biliverdin-producing heme oxygenase [Silvimonas sp. JCM 19000]
MDLKLATEDRHEAVDRAFSGFALATRSGYEAFLLAHAAALFPLEERLEALGIGNWLTDWPERRRREALAADLAQLGLSRPAPLAVPAIDVKGLAGAAYVLEGSRLGARFLARHVLAGEDHSLHAATRYLTHHAEQPLWPRFVEKLDQLPADSVPDLRTAALQVFDVFADAAQRYRPAVIEPTLA